MYVSPTCTVGSAAIEIRGSDNDERLMLLIFGAWAVAAHPLSCAQVRPPDLVYVPESVRAKEHRGG